MMVIGSYALKEHEAHDKFLSFIREPKDIDLLATREEANRIAESLGHGPLLDSKKIIFRKNDYPALIRNIEIEIAGVDGRSSSEKYLSLGGQPTEIPITPTLTIQALVPSLEVLFSIKASHIFSPRNWPKHIDDYTLLGGIVKTDAYPELTAMRRSEMHQSKANLNKEKGEFFKDNVRRVFDHDDIHTATTIFDEPMFKIIQKGDGSVACSEKKFRALPWPMKVACVVEEAQVIALERRIIPFLFLQKPYCSPFGAWQYGLMRVCTTLTSGWFRQYAVNHYHAITCWYDDEYGDEYVDKFLKAVDEGRIRPLTN